MDEKRDDTTPLPPGNADSLQLQPDALLEPNQDQGSAIRSGRLRTGLHVAKYALESAVLAVEVAPITNEPLRYGAFAAVEATSGHNPLLGAVVLGGSTLLLEGAAVLAASDLLTSNTSNKLLNWVNKKTKKEKSESMDSNSSKMARAIAALYLGPPVSMLMKQRENPDIPKDEIRRYGLITTAWVAGVCAVEGGVIAEGIGNYADPKKIAGVVLSLVLIKAIPSWLRKRISRNTKPHDDNEAFSPQYKLSQEELDTIEHELVDEVRQENPTNEVVSIWLRPNSKYANFIRSKEEEYFPEVEEVSAEDDEKTIFFAIVDTRQGISRVVHAATITGISFDDISNNPSVETNISEDNSTGFYTVDQLIERGNFSADEFRDFYANKGLDLSKCISVETNFRVGDKVSGVNGISMANLAYLEFFKLVERLKPENGGGAVFATINRATILSFKRFGLRYEPLMGREDMITPESELGRTSIPVVLYYNEQAIELFSQLDTNLPQMLI